MATFYQNIPHTDGYTFNQDALAYATSASVIYGEGDTASQTINSVTRNYKYLLDQTTWVPDYFDEVPTFTPVTINVGAADVFRAGLNTNFGSIESQAETVADNLQSLYDNLSAEAFTGLASDLTTDSTHRLVTDAQKQSWGSRLWLEGDDTLKQRSWDSTNAAFVDVDVTNAAREIAQAGLTIPNATSQLENDAGYVTAVGYTSPQIKYIANYDVTTFDDTGFTPPTSELTVRGTIIINGCTSDMSAEVVFGQTECASGNFSQICETFNGGVYFYCKSGVNAAHVETVVLTTPSEFS